MHLELGVTQKPAVMQSLKQSHLYEFNSAKSGCAKCVQPHPRGDTRAARACWNVPSVCTHTRVFLHIRCFPVTQSSTFQCLLI